MPRGQVIEIGVLVVGNRSLSTKEGVVKIADKWQPNIDEFLSDVKVACDGLPHRIYWRVSDSEFSVLKNYLGLKTALSLIFVPRVYAVVDESSFVCDEPGIVPRDGIDDHSEPLIMSDVEILRCITAEPIPSTRFNWTPLSESTVYTREYEDVYRKLKILMKALSLLCVRSSSGSTAMLEAPPGSREDLVEAARIPCKQPTDLDAMLYGYTNSIYVLDHAQESLPDMDMLQLFASPAGRALVENESQPAKSNGTLTSSLSRDSSSRSKNIRRISGTGTASAPASPPRQRKSSAELYKEAAEILGLTCSMTDSCRCIDCQSNYFDCEEDYGDTRTEVAAGTPILHALSHPLTCTIQ